MVMAVFMAAIVIGCIYYVSGLGAALVAQEQMQDAADATAFSSAVIHARGMNILALINIVLASLLASLVMLSMLTSLMGLAAKVLFAISFFVPAAAPVASSLQTQQTTIEIHVKPRVTKAVEGTMKALSGLQKIVRRSIPVLANVNAMKLARESYQPVVEAGITFPIIKGLPSENGEFQTLCTKAGEYAAELIVFPLNTLLGPVPGSSYVLGPIKKLAKKGSVAYALFYCGEGPKPSAPSMSVDISIPEVETHAGKTCQSGSDDQRADACERHKKELEDIVAAYDVAEGRCSSGGGATNPEAKRLCDVRRRRARTQCDPRTNSRVKKITYREVTKVRHFRLEGERVVEDESTDHGDAEIRTKKVHSAFFNHPVKCNFPDKTIHTGNLAGESEFTDWNFEADIAPLCETRHEVPTRADFRAASTTTIDIEVHEYTDVLHCVEKRTITGEASSDKASKQMKKARPQEMCNCAKQGESMFQIRSVVFGDTSRLSAKSNRGIVAATGAEVSEGAIEKVGELAGYVAMAQAEYYFDNADAKRAEWLWSMEWKARMRRLYFSRPAWKCPEETNTCEGASGDGAKQLQDKLDGVGGGKKRSIRQLLGGGVDSMIVH